MSTTLGTRASGILSTLTRRGMQTSGWTILAVLLAVPAIGYLTLNHRVRYGRWRAMGPGGPPHNAGGYLINVVAETFLARRDTRGLKVYDEPDRYVSGWNKASDRERAMAQKSFLSEPLPRRRGTQAHALRYVVPQRERFASEYQVPKVKEAYHKALEQLRADNLDTVEWKTSVLERRGEAAFVKPSIALPTLAEKSQREIGHVHASDLSGHLMLSLADARDVVAKGWGERHGLSGTRLLPLGYTMIYVPRAVEEVGVYSRIFQAGIDYVCSGAE